MARRTGSADLPLHGGRGPAWLATRMSALGAVITEAIVHRYGRDEFLARLSHPFWFQSFGAVMGMDWHSSGITTSVIGALKRGLGPLQNELGIHVCGGRGQHSRKTPDELRLLGERIGFDGAGLIRASRLASLLGHAALNVWPHLPRDAQEQLFAAAFDDAVIGNSVAAFLHDRHSRTPIRWIPGP